MFLFANFSMLITTAGVQVVIRKKLASITIPGKKIYLALKTKIYHVYNAMS